MEPIIFELWMDCFLNCYCQSHKTQFFHRQQPNVEGLSGGDPSLAMPKEYPSAEMSQEATVAVQDRHIDHFTSARIHPNSYLMQMKIAQSSSMPLGSSALVEDCLPLECHRFLIIQKGALPIVYRKSPLPSRNPKIKLNLPASQGVLLMKTATILLLLLARSLEGETQAKQHKHPILVEERLNLDCLKAMNAGSDSIKSKPVEDRVDGLIYMPKCSTSVGKMPLADDDGFIVKGKKSCSRKDFLSLPKYL